MSQRHTIAPLTPAERAELAKFVEFAKEVGAREERGASREEAQHGAVVKLYPQALPQ